MDHQHISALVQKGLPWTDVFRRILEEMPPEERNRMVLFRELQQHFDVRIETLSMIGAWKYWPDGRYDDDTLNQRLTGVLQLRKDSETV